jgi:nucleoid DNA-binding protein
MNKTDLINEVAMVIGTKKEAQAAVDCFFHTITEALKHKEQVTVAGFATLKVVHRKARSGRNPKTGETITIEARNVPKFTAGRALMDSLEDLSE